MTISTDPIADTPKGVDLMILRKLYANELAICCQVSKTWNERARNDSLWRNLFPDIEKPQKNVKKFIDEHAVTSIGGVLDKFQEFFSRLPPDKIVRFKCLFPFNPRRGIQFGFGYGKVSPKSTMIPDIEEICIFTRRVHINEEKEEFAVRPATHFITHINIRPTVVLGYQIKLPDNEEIRSNQLSGIIDKIYKNKMSQLLTSGEIQYIHLPPSSKNYRLHMVALAILIIGAFAILKTLLK